MHRKVRKTDNDLLKHLFCFFVHLLGSIYKEIEIAIITL